MTNGNNIPSQRNEIGGGFGRQTESRGVPSTIHPIDHISIPLESFLLLDEYSFDPINVGPVPIPITKL